MLALVFADDGMGLIVAVESLIRTLVMGLESLDGGGGDAADNDSDLFFARIAKENKGVSEGEEKGLPLTEEEEDVEDSAGCRVSIVSSEEGPTVLASVKEPTAAYCGGGGLLRRNSTTFPGSPSARRWK